MNKRNDIILPDDINVSEYYSPELEGLSLYIKYPFHKYSKDFIESIVNEFINNDPEVAAVYVDYDGYTEVTEK